jgi:hypothetical protein
MRYLRAFGAFWYDFLIGDRMELFVGPLVALLGAWILVQSGWPAGLVGLLLFVAISLIGAFSLTISVRPKT